MTVPADVVHAYRLSPGDSVVWDEDQVQFFRVTTSVAPAERAEETAEAATAT
jgi:hypothetical protein